MSAPNIFGHPTLLAPYWHPGTPGLGGVKEGGEGGVDQEDGQGPLEDFVRLNINEVD